MYTPLMKLTPSHTHHTTDTEKARLQSMEHVPEYEICMKLSDEVPAGNHVLTIIPTQSAKIILAWVVMP